MQTSSLAIGFDGMAVSLLASNSPIGIFLSAFLFGALSVGAPGMSISDATHVGTPPELIKVVTALIIFFVGAHYIIEHYIKPRKKVEGGQ